MNIISRDETPSSKDDDQLLGRIKLNDARAMDELYAKYAPVIRHQIASVVHSADETEDILQEVFLQLWQKATQFDSTKGSVLTWLGVSARNKAIDVIRSKEHRIRMLYQSVERMNDIPSTTEDGPLGQTLSHERLTRLKNALNELPEAQRDVIWMTYWYGYSPSELTERLHLPLGTVKTRIRDGLKKLKYLLAQP